MNPNSHFQFNDQQQQHSNSKIESNTLMNHHPSSPPCLKINKDSHAIKKSNPHPSLINNKCGAGGVCGKNNNNKRPLSQPQPQQHRRPVIIYTHSPTVIHTSPTYFKELVQKLTGMRSSGREYNGGCGNDDYDQQQQQHNHRQIEECAAAAASDSLPPQQQQQQQQVKSEDINNIGSGDMGIFSDNDSSLTDEINNSNIKGLEDFHVNSYCIPTHSSLMFDQPPNPCFGNNNSNNSNGSIFFNPISSVDLPCSSSSSTLTIFPYSESLYYTNNHNNMPNMCNSYSSPGMNNFSDF